MKAFITGITGFAGSHLAEYLLSCGDELLGCSRSGKWLQHVPADVQQRAAVFPWDLTQPPSEEVCQRVRQFQPDCVYHLGAMSIPADCGRTEPTAAAVATNLEGTRALIDLAQSLPTPPRMLLISSSYVYAPVDSGNAVVSESAPLQPATGYGKTKLAAEQQLLRSCAESSLDGLIARVFQHTGPLQPPRTFVPEWAQQFVRGDNPIRVRSLDAHLDLMDVRDTVRAYGALIQRGKSGQPYNVGSGRVVRTGEVFDMLRQQFDPDRDVIASAPGEQHHPIADIRQIVQHTGWEPVIPLDKTIADILAFWKMRNLS